jgi:diadenosine tetraphosphatase ApaH/serine/threonine PP2A family protein phosphatase
MIIEIIGSVGGQSVYSTLQIATILENNHTDLHYGSQFMGRPGTRLYSADTEIVKLRSEVKLNYKRIREWVVHTLELEQKLAVHHPQKSWFIVELEPGEYAAGNICPRLTPLHTLFADINTYDNAEKLLYLKSVYHAYFRVASLYSKRLDEGLSNFGIDNQQHVYYLDDDIYSWDNFLSFAHILGVLIRNNTWLNENEAAKLGDILHQLVGEFFQDGDAYSMIAGKLRDIFMPDSNRKRIFDVIIRKFQNDKLISKKLHFSDRYLAIFGDVHANLPALDTVLSFLRHENIKQGIVLGDHIGYGPHPTACIERLQDSHFDIIKGNHDHAAVSGEIRRGMSSTASWCIEWTMPQLTPEHKQWLDALPLEFSGITDTVQHWLAVHGSPIDPQYFYGYVYEMTYEDNLNALKQRKIDWCFHGHSHVQGIYARKKAAQDSFYKDKQQNLHSYQHSLICPGSVGQPRDGNLGAQFAILDQRNQVISFHSLPYSLESTINAMQAQAFPESLITRLNKGY